MAILLSRRSFLKGLGGVAAAAAAVALLPPGFADDPERALWVPRGYVPGFRVARAVDGVLDVASFDEDGVTLSAQGPLHHVAAAQDDPRQHLVVRDALTWDVLHRFPRLKAPRSDAEVAAMLRQLDGEWVDSRPNGVANPIVITTADAVRSTLPRTGLVLVA
jgi:anaerobic selenocysteine-containing dehydrogenase